MPKRKRSAQQKLERYQHKIRKIEEEMEKKRRRIRRPLDSSSDNESRDETRTSVNTGQSDQQAMADDNGAGESPDPECDRVQDPMQVETPVNPAILNNMSTRAEPVAPEDTAAIQPASEPTMDVILDPELLTALGTSTSDTPDFGENIHETLSILWTPILKKGLPREEKDKLVREYLIPGNCKLLKAPILNAEISAAVSELSRGRDKKLVSFQQQLGTGLTAINKGLDTLLRSDNKAIALKHLSDSCRILSDLHSCFTKDRAKLITPSLDKNFTHMIQDSERDDTLFGNSLSEKIKASKAIERQGLQIKKTVPNQKTAAPASTSGTRGAHQGNWSGPPRYPSNRGGRGGGRRTNQGPATRRPYFTSTTPPAASRPSQQSKTRAPPHHQ